MSRTTSALIVKTVGGPFTLETVHLAPLRQDEALVEVHATGICHTDLSCADGTLPTAVPAVLGHEGAGVVMEVGSRITHVQPGDKVLLSISHCQECQNCKAGHPHYCDESMPRNFGGRRIDGTATITIDGPKEGERADVFSSFFGQSSFAKYAVVNRASMVKVPQDTDLALFAPLGCGVSTGVGSVLNTLDVRAGATVAVFGVGSVGLSAVMGARLRQAKVIIAIDLNDKRLEVAKKVGATHTLNAGKEDVVAEVKKIVPPGGVGYAVDCTGVPAVIETMIECLAVRGRAVQVGFASTPTVGIKILQHIVRGQEYVGCAGGDTVPSKMMPYLMKQHADGNFPLHEIVSHYQAADFAQAFEDSKSGKAIKAVLNWV